MTTPESSTCVCLPSHVSVTSRKSSYDLHCCNDRLWNNLVHSFLSGHDPSRLMDFYNIFAAPSERAALGWNDAPEGAQRVAADWNSAPEGACVQLHLPSTLHTSHFNPPSFWSKFLNYIRNGSCPASCNISMIASPSCFTGIASDGSLLIIDSGASVCISPFRSDFHTY